MMDILRIDYLFWLHYDNINRTKCIKMKNKYPHMKIFLLSVQQFNPKCFLMIICLFHDYLTKFLLIHMKNILNLIKSTIFTDLSFIITKFPVRPHVFICDFSSLHDGRYWNIPFTKGKYVIALWVINSECCLSLRTQDSEQNKVLS